MFQKHTLFKLDPSMYPVMRTSLAATMPNAWETMAATRADFENIMLHFCVEITSF